VIKSLALLAAALACAAAPPYDPAMKPAVVHSPPGVEYTIGWSMFQGIPGIERAPKGRLWATWYAGGGGEGPLNYVVLVTSSDDGRTWSAPKLVVDIPDWGRVFDPCLWMDPQGKLWLFWAQSLVHWDGRGGVWFINTSNPDAENPKWSKPRRIADGVMMNKPLVLKSGKWLFPVAMWPYQADAARISQEQRLGLSPAAIQGLSFPLKDAGQSMVYESSDRGRSFEKLGYAVVPKVGHNEHMIVERRDGSLWMLVRADYGIGQSFSTDGGRTWSEGVDTGLLHPSARFYIGRLRSGNLLMVRHNPPPATAGSRKPRSHLAAYISTDDGKSWSAPLMLDDRNGVSYPDAAQAPDGRVFVIYDRNRTTDREILMANFVEDDILQQRTTSGTLRLRQIVARGADASTPDPRR
jgi:hypothetical protein